MRIEVVHRSHPGKRALLALPDGATLNDLHKAVEQRLGVLPQTICLAETEAQILSICDVRDGDSLSVTSPQLPSALPKSAEDEFYEGPSSWRQLVKVILTFVIFVMMERAFQRLVYIPIFHEDPADDDSKWVEGSHHFVDRGR